MSLQTHGLSRRLLEVAVVVGFDEETGLQLRYPTELINDDEGGLFRSHIKPHLLDIISGPQESNKNTNYLSSTAGNTRNWRISIQNNKDKRSSPAKRPSLQRSRSMRKLRMRANRSEDVPVSTDFLSNLPYVCLPFDSKLYREAKEPQIHSAVLTDISGSRHYAVVLRLSQPHTATKTTSESAFPWKLGLDDTLREESNTGESTFIRCFTPLCICFVTNLPYFDVLKDALSCVGREWKKSSSYSHFRVELEKFVTNLSIVPYPPPGIRINFVLNGLPFSLFPSDEVIRESVVADIDLTVPLFVFMNNYEILIKIITSILLEQRLVFVSENPSLLVIVMEALLHYITPFHWPHPYIPLLFSDSIEFVACPGIFLMGCHSMHKEQIQKIENDQIVVDLDKGEAMVCASYDNVFSHNDDVGDHERTLQCIPLNVAEKTIKSLSELRLFNVDHLRHPNAVTLEEIVTEKTLKKRRFNKEIKNIFLEMMLDLFGNTVRYLDHETSQFCFDDYLKTVNGADRPFYEQVVKTYMFKKFVKERLKRKADTFSRLAQGRLRRSGVDRIAARRSHMKVRSIDDVLTKANEAKSKSTSVFRRNSLKTPSGQPETPPFSANGIMEHGDNSIDGPMPKQSFAFEEADFANDDELLTFNLPTFPEQGTNFNATFFYQRCATVIGALMKKIPEHTRQLPSHKLNSIQRALRASCLVLSGLYRLASGNVIGGLEDLHDTAKEDFRIFPLNTIKSIIASLPAEERRQVRTQRFYKGDEYYEASESTTRQEAALFVDDDLPCKDLDFSTFSAIVLRSAISNDDAVISHLFDALSSCRVQPDSPGQDKVVDHEIFEIFYNTWKLQRKDCGITLTSITSVDNGKHAELFRDSESILKVSDVVSSGSGTGRLILTSVKLLFMSESHEECKFMARLTQIDDVRVTKQKSFLRNFSSLQLKKKDEQPFRVTLKSECEVWKMMVEEMRIGRNLSKNLRDHLMTSDIATQNVRLMNVLYEAANDGELLDPASAMQWGARLCNYTQLDSAGTLSTLPVETNQMLLLTIDLSPKDTRKSSVNAVLYAPSDDMEVAPRVWAALSSSKIRLVETTSWKLDSRSITDCRADLLSMCVVDEELWVGASDKSIYVIQCATLQRTQVLHEHSSSVVSVFKRGDNVVSASSSGKIILWNKELKKKSFSFTIPFPHHQLLSASRLNDEAIICCCPSALSLYALNGTCLQLLKIKDFMQDQHEITYCLPINTEEICAGDSHGSLYLWRRGQGAAAKSSPHLGHRHNRFTPILWRRIFDSSNDVAITCIMAACEEKIWIGNGLGEIMIINSDDMSEEKLLKAHSAAVTSLCQVEKRYVISGSESRDGKISLWRFEQI